MEASHGSQAHPQFPLPRPKSLGEILNTPSPPKLRHHQSWGSWRLDAERLVLEYVPDGCWKYEIDLERIRDSAGILDWIFQLRSREMDLAGMLAGLDAIFHPQRNLCSCGMHKRLPAGFFASRIGPPTGDEREESDRHAREIYEAWCIPIPGDCQLQVVEESTLTVKGQRHER